MQHLMKYLLVALFCGMIPMVIYFNNELILRPKMKAKWIQNNTSNKNITNQSTSKNHEFMLLPRIKAIWIQHNIHNTTNKNTTNKKTSKKHYVTECNTFDYDKSEWTLIMKHTIYNDTTNCSRIYRELLAGKRYVNCK